MIVRTALLSLLVLQLGLPAQAAETETISLAGEWRFAMGPAPESTDKPLPSLTFADSIVLPGTTDERGKGPENRAREVRRLTRVHPYVGPAWYQREITVKEAWRGCHQELFLERTKTSAVWVDGKPIGKQHSLACPHIYDLSDAMTPGEHRLTILVDNSLIPPVGDPHQVSDQTQTNWNGIIGRIELRVLPPVWIENLRVFPDVAARKARVCFMVTSIARKPFNGKLSIHVQNHGPGAEMPFKAIPDRTFKLDGAAFSEFFLYDTECDLGDQALLWDEFSPSLCDLTVIVEVRAGSEVYKHAVKTTFGLRDFKAAGTQFQINGRTTFLRGKHDACVFPLTGHPPMDVPAWRSYFQTCKSYGINHVRFHTWCPPDAAFTAADELGLYLQPELPNWKPFVKGSVHDRYLAAEGERILDFFANHPSFVMLSLGNELGGGHGPMKDAVQALRDADQTRLYAQGSNNYFWKPTLAAGDDYWTTVRTMNDHGVVKSVRGSFADADAPLGHVQVPPFSTMIDYRKEIAGVPIPVIGHEVGQYTVYPDFREIDRYTGVVRARNFEITREKLKAKGMLDQSHDFLRASGALAVLCYREDIEAALRTPGFGGFQLLDLQDFPGQGTALVGILNAFMESKGLIEPEEWRHFCSETVPLLRFAKYTWTADETFTAAAEAAHYGPAGIAKTTPEWSLADSHGQEIASGKLPTIDLPQGRLTSLGTFSARLQSVVAPQKLVLSITVPRKKAPVPVNHYNIWVYPKKSDPSPDYVLICHAWDAAARDALHAGRRVLLMPQGKPANTLEGGFATDFWCWPMFHNKPGTMGLLCDPQHPALAAFPTEFHSDWQWADIVCAARPVILDAAPADYRPIVQVIDNFNRNNKLGLVFEARVGRGRLLVVACDLTKLQDKPAARQLFASLIDYAASEKFNPAKELPMETLQNVLGVAEKK
jgi:hypothetical protein